MCSCVPCNVCHGAESIVTLGDGDPGHLVHGQDGGLLLGQQVHQLGVLSWVDEADESGGVLHHLHLVDASGGVETGGSDLEPTEEQGEFNWWAYVNIHHIAHQSPNVVRVSNVPTVLKSRDWPTALPLSAPLPLIIPPYLLLYRNQPRCLFFNGLKVVTFTQSLPLFKLSLPPSALHLKSHLEQHIRRKDIFHVLDGGPGLGILLIGELGGLSGSRLHNDVEALLDERLDAGGR